MRGESAPAGGDGEGKRRGLGAVRSAPLTISEWEMPVPGILTVWRIPRLLTFSLNPRGPTFQDDLACMCSRISISIPRWPWRRRESRTHAPGGSPKVEPTLQGKLGSPRLSPHSPHDDVRPLSGAPCRGAPSGCRRGRSFERAHAARSEKAALCAAREARAETPERAGATPPPAPLCGPGSDPAGGRSSLVAHYGDGSE